MLIVRLVYIPVEWLRSLCWSLLLLQLSAAAGFYVR